MIPSVFSEKTLEVVISCVLAYLIGSISTGLLVAKAAGGPDLRQVGSGNTGASNVQRTMGWKYGLITFFADAMKGVISCLIALLLTGDQMACLAAGLFAVIGHNWPVFFGFKGGKGVSTSAGVLLFCFPWQGAVCAALTIALIAWLRYISLGSMFLLTSYAILVSLTYQGKWLPFVIAWSVVMALICIGRHHANIVRLVKGTENKLGNKAKQGGNAK